jgi:hypothetical protein
MTGATLPISVVVIARNEERRIGDCSSSMRLLTDDIVVVDSIVRLRACYLTGTVAGQAEGFRGPPSCTVMISIDC